MELTITNTIDIDIDEILDCLKNNPQMSVEDAVEDYICGLDDMEYYLIGCEEAIKIIEEVERQLAKKRNGVQNGA